MIPDLMALEVIQIIEDDPDHAALLDRALRRERYRTNVAHDGRLGLADALRLRPALVLLDVMLPEMDGYEVCRRLRDHPLTGLIPIIMISALGEKHHPATGLKAGADDYITKPFRTEDVIARVEAVLRRVRPRVIWPECYLDGALVLENMVCAVLWRGRRFQLSSPEWLVLKRLAKQAGSPVMREELLAALWGEDSLIHEHELDRYVHTLMTKFEEGMSSSESIVRVPGGWSLVMPRDE